jgi:hypothetical protein
MSCQEASTASCRKVRRSQSCESRLLLLQSALHESPYTNRLTRISNPICWSAWRAHVGRSRQVLHRHEQALCRGAPRWGWFGTGRSKSQRIMASVVPRPGQRQQRRGGRAWGACGGKGEGQGGIRGLGIGGGGVPKLYRTRAAADIGGACGPGPPGSGGRPALIELIGPLQIPIIQNEPIVDPNCVLGQAQRPARKRPGSRSRGASEARGATRNFRTEVGSSTRRHPVARR